MANTLFQSIKEFFSAIERNELLHGALNLYDGAIQFRVVDKIPDDINWFGGKSGDWYYIDVKNGALSFGEGDIRAQRDFRACPLVEVERSTLADIFEGRLRPRDAFFGGSLHISNFYVGGASGMWVLALLRLGQTVKSGYWNYLPLGLTKMFMKTRYI